LIGTDPIEKYLLGCCDVNVNKIFFLYMKKIVLVNREDIGRGGA
jgi:hypothetical protein